MKRKSIGFAGLVLVVGWIVYALDAPDVSTPVPPPTSDAVGPCVELERAFANILPALDQDVYLATHFVVEGQIVEPEVALASGSNDAWIVAITNLPDGTPLDVRGRASGATRTLGRAVTRHGCFEVPLRELDPGLFADLDEVEIATGCLDEAAPRFQSVLAETRGHLQGKAVVHEPCLSVRQAVRPRGSDDGGLLLALLAGSAVGDDVDDRDDAERDVDVRPAPRAILGSSARNEIARLIRRGRALGQLRRRHHAGDLDALVACNEERMRLDGEVGGLLQSGDARIARELMRFHEPLLTCTSCDAAHGDASCDEAASMLRAERNRALARAR